MKIIQYPHPTLRHVSKPLKKVDAELRSMIRSMFELMYEHKGVGLAANQVDLPYRIFVANPKGDSAAKEEERVYINPVLSHLKGNEEAEEGCLSIPQVYGDVRRADRLVINAFNLKGEEIRAEVDGFLARIIQHETDHLDGRLFIDRLPTTERMALNDDLEELEIEFRLKQEQRGIPSNEEIALRIANLEKLRT